MVRTRGRELVNGVVTSLHSVGQISDFGKRECIYELAAAGD